MNKAEIAIIKELRGSILKFLQDCYPHIMARDSLIATYYEYEKVDDICDAIEYLKEKGDDGGWLKAILFLRRMGCYMLRIDCRFL